MNAPETALEIKAFFAAIGAFGTALFGWVGWVVVIWLFALVLDYITGSAAAAKAGEWSSKTAREGLWHKAGSIAAVLVAAMCDIALGVVIDGIGAQAVTDWIGGSMTFATPMVCIWYIITEAGSILENADKLGAKIPDFLRKRLDKLKDKVEDENYE